MSNKPSNKSRYVKKELITIENPFKATCWKSNKKVEDEDDLCVEMFVVTYLLAQTAEYLLNLEERSNWVTS